MYRIFSVLFCIHGDAVQNVNSQGRYACAIRWPPASVLDVQMKEGNDKEYHAAGDWVSLHPVSPLKGLLKKIHQSFIVSARRTL